MAPIGGASPFEQRVRSHCLPAAGAELCVLVVKLATVAAADFHVALEAAFPESLRDTFCNVSASVGGCLFRFCYDDFRNRFHEAEFAKETTESNQQDADESQWHGAGSATGNRHECDAKENESRNHKQRAEYL